MTGHVLVSRLFVCFLDTGGLRESVAWMKWPDVHKNDELRDMTIVMSLLLKEYRFGR